MDENSPADNSPAVATRRLLDEAARAYMDGDYDAALSSWQRVLDVDPDNPRAREGVKKVSMLHAGDGPDEAAASPVISEIERHLEQRRFDAAVELCREQAEAAGPALTAALRQLQDRAERARAVEPEIQHAMGIARRSLQEGKLRDAIPQLKRVLALDGEHPVARRLMEGIRERARKRSGEPAPDTSPAGQLPASGRPGSDALEQEPAGEELLADEESQPAPPGRGLPSSPLDADGETIPEIELEMINLEPPAGEESSGDGGDASVLPGSEDEEVVADMPEPIQLAPEPETPGHRFSQTAVQPDAPFVDGDEEAAPERAPAQAQPPSIKVADGGGVQKAASPRRRDPVAAEGMAASGPGAGMPKLPPQLPRRPRRSRVPVLMAAVILLGAAGVAGAWSMGWLSSFMPSAQPLEVVRPEPQGDTRDVVAAETAPAVEAGAEDAGTADGTPARTTASRPEAPPPAPRAAAPKPDPRAALALFESGQDLFEAGRFEEAAAAFRQAILLDPVNADIASWQAKAEARLKERRRMEAETASAMDAFQSKDFETALRKFYRLQEKGTAGSFERSIVNSWYNWGLQLLAAGNLREADRKMDEVLAIQHDEEAVAVKKLIEEYQNRAKDRVFYVRVEALRYRPIDA